MRALSAIGCGGLVLAAGIVACGGGSGAPPSAPISPTLQLVAVPVVVTESLPFRSHAVTALSIQAAVAQGSPPPAALISLVAGAANCTASATALVCNGTVQAPIGQDAFTIETLASANAVLSTGSLTFNVGNPPAGSIAISNAILLALNGVIAKLQLNVNPNTLTIGTPATTALTVTALDATGATIVGSQTYSAPVTISVILPSPSPGASTSPAPIFANIPGGSGVIGSVAAPGQTLPLAYNGEPAPSGVNLVANTVGITSPQVPLTFVGTPTPTPFVIGTITPPPVGVQPPTPTPGPVALSPNFVAFVGPESPPITFTACDAQPPLFSICLPGAATFTATASDPKLLAVSPTATANPTSGLATFTLAPGATPGGPVIVTVTDAQGRTGTLFAYINQASIILQEKGRAH